MTPQPLLLLSGMLGDDSAWREVASLLDDVATVAFPSIAGDDTVAGLATSVLADAPDRFALAGHSLGGIVALEMVRTSPHRVTRLALVNTSARAASAAQLESWARLAARSDAGEFDAVAAELGLDTLPESRRDPELVRRNTAMAHTIGPDGFRRQLAAQAGRPDAGPSLGGITVPTLVVSGALDHVCPPEIQTELAAAVAGARHETIPDAGHMSPLETPDALAALLRTWLAA